MLGEGVRHARHCSSFPAGAGNSFRNLQREPDGMNICLGWFSLFLKAGGWIRWLRLVPQDLLMPISSSAWWDCLQAAALLLTLACDHATPAAPTRCGWPGSARPESRGSLRRQDAGAQSAVLVLAFPSDTMLVREWVLLHVFCPASWAAEVLGLQPFLHAPAAATAPPGMVGAGVPSPLGGWSAAGRRLPSHPVVAEV